MIYWMDILIGIELNSKTQKHFHKDLLNYSTLDKNPLMHTQYASIHKMVMAHHLQQLVILIKSIKKIIAHKIIFYCK